MNILVSYSDLKLSPGVWGYTQDAKEYRVFKDDFSRQFYATLEISEYQNAGSDCKDFYDNIKPFIDQGIYKLDQRRADNKHVVHVSERKIGTMFNWTSFFDSTGVHDGPPILVDFVGIVSPNPYVCEGTFSTDIRLTEGTFWWSNVPFGSTLSFEVYCPANGYYFKDITTGKPCALDFPGAVPVVNVTGDWLLLARFMHIRVPETTSSIGLKLTSSDLTTFLQGYKLKLTLDNADPTQSCTIEGMLKNCRKFLK